ncbi:hypothetical protein ASG52_25225 [Methylobacterium sp. Leaf456]|uniref:hypothetical protein n=1 Tax=Methylobacterium sp. Leaf456 TaxID=1736382 RepID=UPI0006F46E9C|nr:hypothetical protein [Methylobacterium sp. Leaf456]KQT55029.1 hypothetical protein ASG52_25225 [Methylobacterium sp. Leaf456]
MADTREVPIVWDDPAERARAEGLIQGAPELRDYFVGGIDDAVKHVLPDIARGALGGTALEIEAALAKRIAFTIANLRREMGASGDQSFLYQAGFLCACRAVLGRFLQQQTMLGEAIEAARPQPHALALGSRAALPASSLPGGLPSYLAGQPQRCGISFSFCGTTTRTGKANRSTTNEERTAE